MASEKTIAELGGFKLGVRDYGDPKKRDADAQKYIDDQMSDPEIQKATEGLSQEQKNMLVGLNPDEIRGVRRGEIKSGKIGDPNAKSERWDSAPGTADKATFPTPTEDTGEGGSSEAPVADESAGLSMSRKPVDLATKKRLLSKLQGKNSTPPTDRDASGNRIEPAQAPQGVGGSGPSLTDGPAYQDPMEAFNRQRNADRAELAKAQADSAQLTKEAEIRNQFYRGVDQMTLTAPDEKAEARRIEAAKAPVTNLLARRDQDAKDLQQFAEQNKLQGQLDEDNPGSAKSKRAGMYAYSRGWVKASEVPRVTASMIPLLEKGATIDQAERHAQLQAQTARDHDATVRRGQDLDYAAKMAEVRAKGAGGGKGPGDAVATQLASFKTAIDDLGSLDTKVGGKGPLSGLWSKLPTENNVWESNRSALVDSAASAMSMGKRPSIPLLKRIDESMPHVGDPEPIKIQKLQNLRHLMTTGYNNMLRSLESAGRNMSNFQDIGDENGGIGQLLGVQGGTQAPQSAGQVINGKTYHVINGQLMVEG